MDNHKEPGCCSCGPGCCGSIADNGVKDIHVSRKQIVIDFLYLDLSVCTRCQGADSSLDEALGETAGVLEAAGNEVIVNRIEVNTEELATAYKFVSSPTIRVNGRDIQMEVKETLCDSCGDLCGDQVECRIWVYEGNEYPVPPKGLIIESILKAVYGGNAGPPVSKPEYTLPENLKRFYAAMKNRA